MANPKPEKTAVSPKSEISSSLSLGAEGRNPKSFESPYGINQRWVRINARDAALFPEMGIKWVRVHFFWNMIEPEPGRFCWDNPETNFDEAMRVCTAGRFGILARINTPPPWACSHPNTHMSTPEAFAKFVRILLERYPGQIHALEVLNEENVNRWPGVFERDARLYVPVLKAGYNAVKEYNPAVLVLSAGIWQMPMHYLEDMYKFGAKGYFDVFNYHYYTTDQAVNQGGPAWFDSFRGSFDYGITYFHDVMARHGDGDNSPIRHFERPGLGLQWRPGHPEETTSKKIWLTEFGWAVTPEDQSHGVGEDRQAEFTLYCYKACKDSGIVTKVFPYCYHNTDGMAMIHENDTSAKHGPSAAANHRRKIFCVLGDFARQFPAWPDPGPDKRRLELGPPAASRPAPIANVSFEEGLVGWSAAEGHPRVELDERRAHSGRRSLKLGIADEPVCSVAQKGVPVEPGRGYELRGWIYMEGGSADEQYPHGMIELEFVGRDGRVLDARGPISDNRAGKTKSTNYYISETFGQWYEIHYPFFTPDDVSAIHVYLCLRQPKGPVQGEAWFDDISIRPFQVQVGR